MTMIEAVKVVVALREAAVLEQVDVIFRTVSPKTEQNRCSIRTAS
jgi:hypothetical protein